MPISRKTVDKVQIVLSNVNKFITPATKSNQTGPVPSITEVKTRATESEQTDPGPSVAKIRGDLDETNSQSPKFKNWKDELVREVISLDENIDHDILENGIQIDEKLRSIHLMLKQIKILVKLKPTPVLAREVISLDENNDDDILKNGIQKDNIDEKLRSIHVMLEQIKNLVNELPATESEQTHPGPSVTEIQSDLDEINSQFSKFKDWEDDLVREVISLDENIDDDIFENNTQKDKIDDDILENGTQKDKIDEKLRSIHVKLKLRYIHVKLKQMKILVNQLPTTQRQSKQPDRSEDQARKVSAGWSRYNVEENILVSSAIANLQLIYDVLETQLKLCLLCFAIFPENAVIKKRPLIYWWIGEGLVTKYRDKTGEEAGEEIFVKLTKKGLLHPILKSEKSPIVDWCTMHPWIRRMLVSVATKAQFFDFNTSGQFSSDYTKSNSHRACLVSDSPGLSGNTNSNSNSSVNSDSNSKSNSNSNSNSTPEKLLTIFNVDEHYLNFETDLLPKFKKLVILHLGRWQNKAKHHIEVANEEFLNGLQAQKHLRYLSLKGISRITAIPDSIVECINLEILDLRACHNLERLPNDMGRLGKLTHLDISECYLLENMPKGLGKLSSLQVLKGFVIDYSRKPSCKLGDLVQLKKLRKLSIHTRNEVNNADAGELRELEGIASLRVLTISWAVIPSKPSNSGGGGGGAVSQPTTQATVKSPSLPPNLEKLDLRCFPQRTSPEWLKPSGLKDLKRLYIRGGELGGFEFENGKEWKVEILQLKYLKNFKTGSYLRNAFPGLRYFEMVRRNQNETDESRNEEVFEWNRDEDGWDALTAKHRSPVSLPFL